MHTGLNNKGVYFFMSLNTQRAGFRVILIQLPSQVTKVLQDAGLIPDGLLPSSEMDALAARDCMLPHHSKNERMSPLPPWIKNSGLPSNEAIFGHVPSHSGPVGCEIPSADWLRSELGAYP